MPEPGGPPAAAPSATPPPIPVTVIGGYLGAGKTTLVNSLLRQADGARIAVLVNDFGDIAIDADLIEARDDDLLQLAGGCVCCSVGSDLVSTLMALPARLQARPDHVLLETSGVAMPGMVAATLSLVGGVRRDGVIVLADALHLDALWRDRYLGDTIERQFASADLIVLGKGDLAGAEAVAAHERELRVRHPGARVIAAVRGALPIDLALGVSTVMDPSPPPAGARTGTASRARPRVRPSLRRRPALAAAAGARFASLVLRAPEAIDAARLAAVLAAADSPVLRAKGFVRDLDSRAVVAFHTVVGQVDVRPFDGAVKTGIGRFVVIGERRRLAGVESIPGLAALGVVAG
ncbi:MAG: GTP-binding protein [Lautropia sp.]